MADKQAGGLSLRIGLTLSQLQSDFLAAEQTVKQGIAAINRQQNIIKLRTEADLAGLDAVADKTKIIEVQERSLTQLLDLQRDKLKLATAAYQDVAQSKGANSAAAKQLETSMERERLAVARLEAQLKSLSAQKISVDTTHLQDTISKLNARIQHIKIQAEIDTSKLKGANAAFDAQKIHIAAVTKEIELQREKLTQLQAQMYKAAQANGAGSVQTLNIKSNVLQQIQQINQLEAKLKELRATNINLQVRADSLKQVEASIHENIARINAKIEHIRVKTDIDVSKLGAAATEFDKAKAHVQGLNRELDLQNKKLLELKNALRNSISANGLNNVKTINLQTEIQKQIQAINQLQAKIKELNNIAPPKSSNNLLSNYLNIKGDVTGKLQGITNAFSNLRGATNSADSAVTSVLNVIGEIPHPVGRAAAALLSLPLIFKGIENSIISMTRAAAASGDAVYVMSRGMQMSTKDAGKFSTNAKVAGTDVNSLATAIKQVQRQIVRGGDDSKASEWLKKYGESARDANGNLKDLNEMTFALSRALHKAQAEGKGAEFVFSVFRNISADDITAIEDWIAVNEQAATIVKNGLANPALAHEVKGNLNALAVQEGQLKASFENALLPVANEIIPRVTERMGKLTQILADNKDVILALGRDFAEVWGAVEDTVDKVGEGLGVLAKLARDNRVVRQTSQKDIIERYKDDASIKNSKDLVEREIAAGGYTEEDIRKLRARNDLYLKELKQTDQDMKAVWAKRREEFAKQNEAILRRYADDDSIKTATDLLNKLTDAEKEAIERVPSTFGSLQERIAALHPEFEKLQAEAKEAKKAVDELLKKPLSGADASAIGQERRALGENDELLDQIRLFRKYEENAQAIRDKLTLSDYDLKKSELQRWLQEQLPRDAEQSLEKYDAVMKEYAARSEQIEQERADKLKEIRDSIAAADKTALQNKLDTIDKERQAWIKAGMEEAEAEILAEKQKADFIKNIEQELSDEIQAVNQNDLQRKLSQIEKEKQAWIKKGAEEARAEELAQAKRLKAYQETEQKLNEIRNSVLLADRSDLEKRLADIDKEKEAWIQLGMEKAEAEELAQKKREQIIEEANEKVAEDTEKAVEEAARKTEESFERAEQKNEALRNSALNVLKQEAKEFEVFMTEGYNGLQKYLYDQLIKSGVNPEYLKKMTPELLSDYQNATKKAMRSFMPNWEDPYTGKVYRPQIPESSEELKGAQEKATATVRDFSTATNAATGALYNFAEAANYAIVDGKKTTMSEALGTNYAIVDGVKTTMNEALGRLPTATETAGRDSALQNATENVTQSFSAMPPATKAATDALGTLPTAVQGVTENLSELTMPQYDIPKFETPQLETLNNPFAGMTQDLQVTIQRFTEMNSGVEAVTVKLNNLSAALETLLMQSPNQQTPTEQRTPVEVNTTVQIEEAHAWDSQHIQELADKVADIIKPEIISAVGGDSNSY